MNLFSRKPKSSPQPLAAASAVVAVQAAPTGRIDLPTTVPATAAVWTVYNQERLAALGEGHKVFRLTVVGKATDPVRVGLISELGEVGRVGERASEVLLPLVRKAERAKFEVYATGDVFHRGTSKSAWGVDLLIPTGPHTTNIVNKRLRGE